ncbi:histidine kinase [Muricauda sp. CAU 1633]|nr:histidine kinase [Muricauda sp. CAU 1633]
MHSQNAKIVDSLLQILKSKNYSGKKEVVLLADIAHYHPSLDSAVFFANKSIKKAIELGEPVLEAEALEIISHKERKLGNNVKSFQASFQALQIYEAMGLTERQAASYTQLASNYMSDQNYQESIFYLKKARGIYETLNQSQRLNYTVLNLGEMYRLKGHLDSAETCFKYVLKMNKILNDKVAQGYSLGNLGMVYNDLDNLEKSKEHLLAGINILLGLQDVYSSSVYLAELGKVYKKEDSLIKAEHKFMEAVDMARAAGLKEQVRDFSLNLVNLYEQRHEFDKALQYQKLFQVYQDSMVNKANIQKIEQLKAGYEIDKRESEIGLLSEINQGQKYFLWALTGGVLISLLFIYLLNVGNKKIKTANIELLAQKTLISKREQEKELLLKELNHRVKNNLQMISSLLSLQSHELKGYPAQESVVSGKQRVEALSLVHRKLYQEGLDTCVMIKEYIEELVLGLFHGYDASFTPEIKIDDISIHVDTAVPIALIVNEVTVNALKYAYVETASPVFKITIKKEHPNRLRIQVIDNGIGFMPTATGKGSSYGLKLVHSLVQQLEGTIQKLGKNGTHWNMNLKIK